MRQLTISLKEDQEEFVLSKVGEEKEFSSKSEVIREAIDRYEDLHVKENHIEELEQEIERVHNEKRTLIEQRKENQAMREYIEEEQSYRRQSLSTRLKWFVFGRSD